ncbi:Tetraspanin/Peripherin [Trinorchestia longiramus]|nr:Tetraspanin/Peripherin [Trinorchestia longiramus]
MPHIKAWMPHIKAWMPHMKAWMPHIKAWMPHIKAWMPHIKAWMPHIKASSRLELCREVYAPKLYTLRSVHVLSVLREASTRELLALGSVRIKSVRTEAFTSKVYLQRHTHKKCTHKRTHELRTRTHPDMLGQRTGITCIRNTLCVLNAITWHHCLTHHVLQHHCLTHHVLQHHCLIHHVLQLLGCAVLGAGIWLRASYGGYASLLHHYEAISADSLCITAGVTTFVLSFCGCCGSWCQSRCMLVTYFCLVVGVFALELTAGAVMFAHRNQLSGTIASELRAGLRAAGNLSQVDPVVTTWHRLHTTFQVRTCGSYCGLPAVIWPDFVHVAVLHVWGETQVPDLQILRHGPHLTPSANLAAVQILG